MNGSLYLSEVQDSNYIDRFGSYVLFAFLDAELINSGLTGAVVATTCSCHIANCQPWAENCSMTGGAY